MSEVIEKDTVRAAIINALQSMGLESDDYFTSYDIEQRIKTEQSIPVPMGFSRVVAMNLSSMYVYAKTSRILRVRNDPTLARTAGTYSYRYDYS